MGVRGSGRRAYTGRRRQAVALHGEGLTQEEIAARLGVSHQRVSQLLQSAGIRSQRGFARLSPEERRHVSSLGGKAGHAKGAAHEFTHEEAVSAGRESGCIRRAKTFVKAQDRAAEAVRG
jgi:transcriptional regulator with XRE-family HTH domain